MRPAKTLALLLALVMILASFSSCAKKEDSGNGKDETTAEKIEETTEPEDEEKEPEEENDDGSINTTVNNVFVIGDVDIKLDEADVDEYGELESDDRVTDNKYKLLPGRVYRKDPTVTVKAGSAESFVRITVLIEGVSSLCDIFDGCAPEDLLDEFTNGTIDNNLWIKCDDFFVEDKAADIAAYTFYFHVSVASREKDIMLPPLFEEIMIPADVSNEQLGALDKNGLTISISAQAVADKSYATGYDAFAALVGKVSLEDIFDWFDISKNVENIFAEEYVDILLIESTYHRAGAYGDGIEKTDAEIMADAENYDDYLAEQYKNIVPGRRVMKNPYVINTGDNAAYVRIRVIVDAALMERLEIITTQTAVNDGSVLQSITQDGNNLVATFIYTEALEPGEMTYWSPISGFVISADLDNADIDAFLNTDLVIRVEADAILADIFDSAEDAFASFDSNTDSDTTAQNVMVVGKVDIEQNEWERAADGTTLVPYTQDKPLYPAVTPSMQWSDSAVSFDQIGAKGGSEKTFVEPNAIDKYITVENTGESDAYVRTLVAFERGSVDSERFDKLVGISYYDKGWTLASAVDTTIDGNNYQVIEFVYTGRNGEAGVLASGEITQASLCQLYLDYDATNEDIAALDGNGNGCYDVLALSQAVQAEGFADAESALNAAFGEVNATNLSDWFSANHLPDSDENGEEQKEPEAPLEYITITLSAEDVYSGDLVLVNAYHEYHFPADMEGNIVANAEYKNEHFGLSAVYPTSKSMSSVALEAFNRLTEEWYLETGFESLQVNSAYRDYEDQDILYTNSVRDNGIDYTVAYVANPGYSEHHTGLGIDLNVNRNGAISYVGTDPECAWFRDGCKDYGFILRYPGDKIDITGIGHETWHYRYVGVPHAQIMVDQNLCLEEYIDYVKDYTYEETCLGYSEETGVYEITADEYYEKGGTMIYYVPATGEDVEVCIPRNCEYKVSGNNVDGYIITCTDK